MRLVVLGANGLLGSNVVTTGVRRGHDIAGTYHTSAPAFDIPLKELDITEIEAVRTVLDDIDPDAVVNCAAMTDVDACKEHPDQAVAVNAEAPAAVARLCTSRDIRFGHVSTDYVFDGSAEKPYSEGDQPHPVQKYGASKLAGERRVRDEMPNSLRIRLAFVWGVHRGLEELTGFPAWVRDSLEAGESVPVFTDQFITPTRAGQAATVLVDLLETGERGLYNVASRTCTTPFEFGKKIQTRMGENSGEIQESSMDAVDRPAERPSYTCLEVDRVERTRGTPQPTLESDLNAVYDYI